MEVLVSYTLYIFFIQGYIRIKTHLHNVVELVVPDIGYLHLDETNEFFV